jgi:hypothetical protein
LNRFIGRLLLLTLLPLGLPACGSGTGNSTKLGREGESCARTADCEDALRCVAQICVRDGIDGDTVSEDVDVHETGGSDLLVGDDDSTLVTDVGSDIAPEANLCGIDDESKTVTPAPAKSATPATAANRASAAVRVPGLVTLTAAQQNAIVYVSAEYGNVSSLCAGVLIAPRVVLTSAHCLDDPETSDGFTDGLFSVVFGSDVNQRAATFATTDVLIATGYDSVTYANDFALLVLPHSALAIPDYSVAPIAFNEDDLPASIVGQQVESAGSGGGDFLRNWTITTVSSYTSATLHSTSIDVDGLGYGYRGGPLLVDFGSGTRIIGVFSNSQFDDNTSGRIDVVASWLNDIISKRSDCGDLVAAGTCDGTQLAKCSEGVLTIEECADSGKICVPGAAGPVCAVDQCPGLDFVGECTTDNVARWCDNNTVKQRHCTPCGQACGFASESLGNYCVTASEVVIPECTAISTKCSCTQCPASFAACLADDACRLFVNCFLHSADPDTCTVSPEGMLLMQQFSACAAAAKCGEGGPLDHGANCGTVTGQGCCKDTTVYYCEEGNLFSQVCGNTGCGWSADNDFYACQGSTADPSSLVPRDCPVDL